MSRAVHSLSGKTVFITGPARGIGAGVAREVVKRGARVGLAGLEPEKLEALAAEVGEENAAWFQCDVRSMDAVQAAVDGTVERFGGIDVVLANAGIAPLGTFRTIDWDAMEATVDVNLLGVMRTLRATLPHLIESHGYAISIASMAAAAHVPLISHYVATKAAVEGLVDSIRMEVDHLGVGMGVAYFAEIDTDMVRDAYDHKGVQEMQSRTPLAAALKPQPILRAVLGLVKGMERRQRRVIVPRRMWPLALAPGLLDQGLEAGMRKQGLADVIRAAESQAGGVVDESTGRSRSPDA